PICHSPTASPPSSTDTLSLHDALPIWRPRPGRPRPSARLRRSRPSSSGSLTFWRPLGDCTARGSRRRVHEELTVCAQRFSVTARSEEHTSELQSRFDLVCRLLLEKKND